MKAKVLNALLTFLLALIIALPASVQAYAPEAQQSDTYSYIVIMANDPIASYDGGIKGLPATKPDQGNKINPNSAKVKKYDQFLKTQHQKVLKSVGIANNDQIYEYTFALNGFSAMLTPFEVEQVAKQPGVQRVIRDELRQATAATTSSAKTDASGDFLGLTDPGGPYDKGITGENVVVGIIDTGIWPEHPSFADDGSYGKPPITLDDSERSACDFGNQAFNPNDADFTCNNKLIGARMMLDTYIALTGLGPEEYESARDNEGHGTHTASTAAGNADVPAEILGISRGTITGIAPRARVVAYKALGALGGYTSDLAAAIDQSVADGVDVINYSIGGGASLISGDDLAFLFAADAGVFVATSAGNSGPGPATVGGPGSVPWITTVGANMQLRFFEGTVVLGNGEQYTGASITGGTDGEFPLVDAADAGNELCIVGNFDPAVDLTGKIVLCKRGSNARVAKSLAVKEAGGIGMVMYNTDDVSDLATDTHWVPSVHTDYTPGVAIKEYIAANPGTATATILGGVKAEWPYAPSMSSFSSRGPDPVALDIIKPDVTAPGQQILAGYSPTPSEGEVPGELFAAIEGTSMSSPHVAGVFALIKQAHPEWSAAEAKSALMTTAYQEVVDNDRMSPAGPFDMGAGHIRPGGKAIKGSLYEPGLVYDAGFNEYLGFLCEAAPNVFGNPTATCGSLANAGIPTTARDLNLPSIGIANVPGSVTIQRTVTSVAKDKGWRTYHVSVSAPEGFDVMVSPDSFRVKPGQSVTYQVTFTNVSAPIGEWQFGSLEWSDDTGQYRVYSPIAVRGTLFDAPFELSASGATGSLNFDVHIGYNGEYTPASHGLVPATETSDVVVQDPDQTFDPEDGYSNAHTFDLSGALFFRVAIPPYATEPEADLDVYVYNPDGVLVASSTNGGTDEQVDILFPEDGTWTVYVHGWAAPGGDSPYTLYSWVLPLGTDNTSLLVTPEGPIPVSSGDVINVEASWSGLADGWYLGAISHEDATSVLGVTLIDVTVP